MSRQFFLVALLGLLCAGAGLWFDAGREEAGIREALAGLHRDAQPPAYRGCDAIYWLAYARDMADSGSPRNRFTRMDNAPDGRPNIGWAALTTWHVLAVSEAWSLGTGLSLRDSIAPSGRWANPALYFVWLAALLIAGWRTGNLPAAAMAILMFATGPRVYKDFGFAAPDHHGWHELTSFGAMAFLAAAVRGEDRRLWFAWAGFAVGMALWIGATEQSVILVAGCMGALAAMILWRMESSLGLHAGADEKPIPAPERWRVFGAVAAVASLLFYLFEFAPHFFGIRLEVNHPFYSLAFLAGAELLCRAQRLLVSPSSERSKTDVAVLFLTASALVAFALACLFGPTSWHVLHQPSIQRYHQEVAECQPLYLHEGWSGTLLFLGGPLFMVACGIALALRRTLSLGDRMALLVCVAACSLCIAASLVQLRWAGLAAATAAALAGVLYSAKTFGPSRAGTRLALPEAHVLSNRRVSWLGVLLPVILIGIWCGQRAGDIDKAVEAGALEQMATFDTAEALKRDAALLHEARPIVVCSGHEERQAWIGFFGGIPCVGSLYWDNPVGLNDHNVFLAGYDLEQSRQIALKRGITHVVVTKEDGGTVVALHYLVHANRNDPEIRSTLAYRLAQTEPNPPDWLKLVPTESTWMATQGIRIYRVVAR